MPGPPADAASPLLCPPRCCRRCRAQAILALLRDEARLGAEREAAAKKRGAYGGFGAYDVQAQGGGAAASGAEAWQAAAAAGDGGRQGGEGAGQESGEPGSPEYRARQAGEEGHRPAGETKGVRCAELAAAAAAWGLGPLPLPLLEPPCPVMSAFSSS